MSNLIYCGMAEKPVIYLMNTFTAYPDRIEFMVVTDVGVILSP